MKLRFRYSKATLTLGQKAQYLWAYRNIFEAWAAKVGEQIGALN